MYDVDERLHKFYVVSDVRLSKTNVDAKFSGLYTQNAILNSHALRIDIVIVVCFVLNAGD